MSNYRKAYTEVLEILSYFPDDEYKKIPKEKIDFYKKHMDKDYVYHINPNIELSRQYISEEANAILVSLFRDFFATENQKEKLNKLLYQNQVISDNAKREKYNPDVFKNIEKTQTTDNMKNNEIQLVEYKESFFTKFINFIKKMLNY